MSGQGKDRVASLIEQQFWLLDKQGKGAAYNVISAFKLANVNVEKFVSAVDVTLSSYQVFQTRYAHDQKRLGAHHRRHDLMPIRKCFDGDEQSEAIKWLSFQSNVPFDLDEGPLFRLCIAECSRQNVVYVALVFHHIVIDLRTKDLISEEISARYNGDITVIASEVNEYEDYAVFCQLGSHWKKQREYWRSALKGVARGVTIPYAASVQHSETQVDLDFSGDLWSSVVEFSKSNVTSAYIVLLSAYFYVVSKYTGETDFCIGVPLSNRQVEAQKNTRGCFVNTVPLRISLKEEDTFEILIAKVRRSLLAAHRNQTLPSVLIFEEANQVSTSALELYNFGFTFEHPMSLSLDGVGIDRLEIPCSRSQLPLFLRAWEVEGQFFARLEFDGSFDRRFALHFSSVMQTFIEKVLEQWWEPLAKIQFTPEKDLSVIHAANQTERHYDPVLTLKSMFERQVDSQPQNTALVYGKESLSYRVLSDRANRLANYLLNDGLKPGDIVAIALERSPDMIIAIYAVVKAGAAYLPLDIDLPSERIDYMLTQAGVSAVIADEDVEGICQFAKKLYVLNSIEFAVSKCSSSNPVVDLNPELPAYLIYTSGSTGLPKGVLNSHKGVCNRLLWMQEYFGLSTSDVVLQKTPTSFDVSVWELFWPLQTGAVLAIAEHNSHRDPFQIDRQIVDYGVTVLHFVPAVLSNFLAMSPRRDNKLRSVICSGEELTVSLQKKFFQFFPKTQLYNLYGPTEAAIDVTYWHCKQEDVRATVPIGRPVANTEIHTLNHCGVQQPLGVVGELCISGPQVAIGYVNSPELTSQVFVRSFDGSRRLYKTGDLARWSHDGVLEYFGRKDYQVKLNGVRIELSEIENVALRHVAIENCVASVVESKSGVSILVLFYTRVSNEGEIQKEEFTEFLKRFLPSYMLPSQYILMQNFALTSSGKIDRKVLPKSVTQNATERSNSEQVEVGSIEEIILNAWREVLGVEGIGLDDTFFDVGGNSLLLLKVYTELTEKLSSGISSVDMFRYPTIRLLASHLTHVETEPSSAVDQSTSQPRAARMRNATSKARSKSRARRQKGE